MRGAVSGAVWGLVLGTTGLGLASLTHEPPVPANQPQTPQATAAGPGPTVSDGAPARTEPPAAPARAIPPTVSTKMADAPAPVITTPLPPLAAPADPAARPPVADTAPTEDATAVAPSVENAVNVAPMPDPAVAPVTDLAPQVSMTVDAAPAAPDVPSLDAVVSPPATKVSVPRIAEDEPAPQPAPPQSLPVAAAPAVDPAPQIKTPPPAAIVVADAPAAPAAPVDPAPLPSSPPDTAPSAGDGSSTTVLPQINTGVRVNRPGADAPAQAGTPADIAAPETASDDAPALQRFAALFENPQGWPLVSIVLIDDGAMTDAAAMLAGLSFPVTVVLDPRDPDAAARMSAYRAAGAEIGLQAALPQGARAQDVEVAFAAALAILPEAVVLFSGGDDVLQGDRVVTQQMIDLLAAEGLGLVAVDRGLGRIARVAAQAGVPAVIVQRDLVGETGGAINRALDQAAFRARQGAGVVLSGPLTADLLAVLSEWADDANINQIAIAPASGILAQP